jgi:hypothetical protein
MERTVARRRRSDAGALPEWIAPQLTQLVDAAPEGNEWLNGAPRTSADPGLLQD